MAYMIDSMQLTMAKLCPEALAAVLTQPQAVIERAEWFAVYTMPRHEKRIAQHLPQRGIEVFCPVYKSVRNWGGRRAQVELPLFASYLFVKITGNQRITVLEDPGVLRFVSCAGRPAPVPDQEMDRLRLALQARAAQPHPFLTSGKTVRIESGALAGLEGKIVRRKGKTRFVVSVRWIDRSIAFEVDAADLRAT